MKMYKSFHHVLCTCVKLLVLLITQMLVRNIHSKLSGISDNLTGVDQKSIHVVNIGLFSDRVFYIHDNF